MFTHYKDMKCEEKCKKLGCFEWLGDPEVIDNITIRYSTYNFLFDFNGNHVYFVPFLSYSELFVESDQF